ncbi:hypothetical protein GP710_10450 [Escherichia coli]|nr:hypothetical protein GP710_10450 [Escherichia coli]
MKQIRMLAQYYVDLMMKLGLVRFSMLLALTLVYGIPPIIGALLPSASFFLISLWMLLKRS